MAPFYNVFAILLGGKEEPFSICKNYNPEGSSHSLKFALELDPRYSSLLDAPTPFFSPRWTPQRQGCTGCCQTRCKVQPPHLRGPRAWRMRPPSRPQPAPRRLWLQHDSQNLFHHSWMDGESGGGSSVALRKIWFPLFGSIKKNTGASRFHSLSPPLFLWAACILDSCEECNGHFAEGAIWTPAGWYLMLAHRAFRKWLSWGQQPSSIGS